MSVNKVILLGNAGKDPVVRYSSDGRPMASFTLATSERAFTTVAGVAVPEKTEWHNIVMWGKNAEFAEKYIRKGSRLYIEGKSARGCGRIGMPSNATSRKFMSKRLNC